MSTFLGRLERLLTHPVFEPSHGQPHTFGGAHAKASGCSALSASMTALLHRSCVQRRLEANGRFVADLPVGGACNAAVAADDLLRRWRCPGFIVFAEDRAPVQDHSRGEMNVAKTDQCAGPDRLEVGDLKCGTHRGTARGEGTNRSPSRARINPRLHGPYRSSLVISRPTSSPSRTPSAKNSAITLAPSRWRCSDPRSTRSRSSRAKKTHYKYCPYVDGYCPDGVKPLYPQRPR